MVCDIAVQLYLQKNQLRFIHYIVADLCSPICSYSMQGQVKPFLFFLTGNILIYFKNID